MLGDRWKTESVNHVVKAVYGFSAKSAYIVLHLLGCFLFHIAAFGEKFVGVTDEFLKGGLWHVNAVKGEWQLGRLDVVGG